MEEKNKPDDYLPDKRERSDSEINIKEGLLPSTPATPANPVPATNKTPARISAKLPQPSPLTPAVKHHHKEFKVGDRVRILGIAQLWYAIDSTPATNKHISASNRHSFML